MAIPLPLQIVYHGHAEQHGDGADPKDSIVYDPEDFQGKAAYQNGLRWYIPLPTTIYDGDDDPPPKPDRAKITVAETPAHPSSNNLIEYAFLLVVTGDVAARWGAAWVDWDTVASFNVEGLAEPGWQSALATTATSVAALSTVDIVGHNIPAGLTSQAQAIQRSNLGNFDLYMWMFERHGIEDSEGAVQWVVQTLTPSHWVIAHGSYLRIPK